MASRDYAALPHEYLEEMEELSDAEFGRLCRALLQYSMTGEVPALSGNERHHLKRVTMREDRYKASYQNSIEKHRSAGKKSAEKRRNIAEHRSTALNDVEQSSTKGNYTNTKTNTETNTNTGSTPLTPQRGELPPLDADFGKVWSFYEQNIGTPPRYLADDLQDWLQVLPAELVIQAMKEAADHNRRNWAYIKAILNRWKESGVRSLADLEVEKKVPSGKHTPVEDVRKKLRKIAGGGCDDL